MCQWNTTTLSGIWAKCPLGCSVLLPVVFNLKLHGTLVVTLFSADGCFVGGQKNDTIEGSILLLRFG